MEYTRYWRTTVEAVPDVSDAHTAGQIFDYGHTDQEGYDLFVQRGVYEGFGVVEGIFSDEKFTINLKTEKPLEKPPEVPVVTRAMVNMEARRRIEAKYPLWRQINMLADGVPAALQAMNQYRKSVQDASNALPTKLPADYASDKWWPS